MTHAEHAQLFAAVRQSVKEYGKATTSRAIQSANLGSPSRAIECGLLISDLRIYRNRVSSNPAQLIAAALDS